MKKIIIAAAIDERASIETVPRGVTGVPAQQLEQISTTFCYSTHELIVDEYEQADYLFNVISGTVLLYKWFFDGSRQVTGFLNEGDFFGIALDENYSYCAEAVDAVTVRRFPRSKLEIFQAELPYIEKQLFGFALMRARDQLDLLGCKRAAEKVVLFLMSLSHRQVAMGGEASPVSLPMRRKDIGDYLGLREETVSRIFSMLRKRKMIEFTELRKVVLLNLNTFDAIADEFFPATSRLNYKL